MYEKTRWKRIAEHKCICCEEPLDEIETRQMCAKCRVIQSERNKRSREKALKQGVCTICKVEKPVEGIRMCQTCRDYYRKYNRERNALNKAIKKNPKKFTWEMLGI